LEADLPESLQIETKKIYDIEKVLKNIKKLNKMKKDISEKESRSNNIGDYRDMV
jgi:hypothetical protein